MTTCDWCGKKHIHPNKCNESTICDQCLDDLEYVIERTRREDERTEKEGSVVDAQKGC